MRVTNNKYGQKTSIPIEVESLAPKFKKLRALKDKTFDLEQEIGRDLAPILDSLNKKSKVDRLQYVAAFLNVIDCDSARFFWETFYRLFPRKIK